VTTIAANRQKIAGDQQVTDGERKFRTHKVRRIGHAVVGCAGTGPAISKFLKWLESGQLDDAPKMAKDDELEAIVLTPAGLFVYGTDCVAEEVLDAFYACGSGAQAALAALHMGADPTRAVEIATLVDNFTGGPVDTVELCHDSE
jgi:ATP-dependent protease HslVU (ClpYQ) peptidase subunit